MLFIIQIYYRSYSLSIEQRRRIMVFLVLAGLGSVVAFAFSDLGCAALVGTIILTIGFLNLMHHRYEQIDDFESIKQYEKVGAIYQAKAAALTLEFTKHLADAYPKHERDIYEKIGPAEVGLYVVKYPELRASETLMALVKGIGRLQSDVYAQQVKSEEVLQRTRVRPRNPWVLRFMIPTE